MATNKSCWRNIIHISVNMFSTHFLYTFLLCCLIIQSTLVFPGLTSTLYIKRNPPIFQNFTFPNLEAAQYVLKESTGLLHGKCKWPSEYQHQREQFPYNVSRFCNLWHRPTMHLAILATWTTHDHVCQWNFEKLVSTSFSNRRLCWPPPCRLASVGWCVQTEPCNSL